MSPLKAAACRVDITPKKSMKLLGWNKDGIDSKGVADPIYARALLLEKDGVSALIVSLDICWASERATALPYATYGATLPTDTREKWTQAAGSGNTALTIHATHTHTAPELSAEAAGLVEKEIAKLKGSLQEVSLKVGTRSCPLAVYRAVNDDTWAEDFLINRTLTVLEFAAGPKPIGRLINFGVHPILFKEKDQINPDLVGAGMWELEEQLGGVSLYIQGFSGDLGPNVEGHYSGTKRSKDANGVRGHGKYLANETKLALQGGQTVQVDFLKAAPEPVSLSTRSGYKDVNPVAIQGIALGTNVLLLSISAEVFNDYSAMVKNYYCPSYRYVLMSGIANGYSGYLPSAAAFKRAAEVPYEIEASPFVPAAQQDLLDGITRLVNALKK